MKPRILATLAAAALAACAGPASTAGRPGGAPPLYAPPGGGSAQPPIAALLGARERLALTSAQVESLDSLSRAWASRDDALNRAALDAIAGERPPSAAALERARPSFEAIARNHRATAEAVGGVLDERQREIACAIQREQHAALAGERGRRAATRAPAPPARGWPWCPPATEG